MWTTREWYIQLEREAAYTKRVSKSYPVKKTGAGGAMKRGQECDAENTGLEQYVMRCVVRPLTPRQIWFWNNHD